MDHKRVFQNERQKILKALRLLDLQTTVVLTLCALLMIVTFQFGSRNFFLEQIFPGGNQLPGLGMVVLDSGSDRNF